MHSGDGKITREQVFATALEIIDREGADALSMRRLGAALGRDPMILYRRAPSKAALLDGVVETVLAQLKVDPADPDWEAQLRAVARDYRALALAHPNVVPLLVTRPLATPLALRPRGTLRPLEDLLALLTRAGFSGSDALHIYRALFGFLNGHLLNELQELVENPDETDDLLRLGLNRLPPREFPLLRSLAHALACYDGAAELERGLDILLTGLATTLTPVGGGRPPALAAHPADDAERGPGVSQGALWPRTGSRSGGCPTLPPRHRRSGLAGAARVRLLLAVNAHRDECRATRRHCGLSVSPKEQAAGPGAGLTAVCTAFSPAHSAVGRRASDREWAPDPAR